jgi:hypothetical protein
MAASAQIASTTTQSPTAKQLNGHPELPQGTLFGLPGITQWSEQVEANDGVSLVLGQGVQTVFQFPSTLINTDILYREIIDIVITVANVPGTQTITVSQYFPYNYVGSIQLSMQNQFNSYDLLNGFDAKLFELMRPQYQDNGAGNYWEQNFVTNLYGSQQNLTTSAVAYTAVSTAISFSIDMPLGIWFDQYFDLDPDGQLRGSMGPTRAFVTPQLMSGSNRIVTPRITMNPIFGATFDNAPYNVSGTITTPATSSGTATTRWQRKVVYQPVAQTDTPILWGWQYARESKQYSLSGRSTVDILLPTTGQLLGLFYRFFDPSAAATGGLGAPININVITNIWLQFGSGLYKFQDNPTRCQRRFARQHGSYLPPQGVLFHDTVVNEQMQNTNANALNTLDTSSCKVHLDFTTTLSSTAYVAIGVESLRYVVQQ